MKESQRGQSILLSVPAVAGTLQRRNVWNSSGTKILSELYSNIRKNSTERQGHIWKGQL